MSQATTLCHYLTLKNLFLCTLCAVGCLGCSCGCIETLLWWETAGTVSEHTGMGLSALGCLSTLVWNSVHSVSEHTGMELNALGV